MGPSDGPVGENRLTPIRGATRGQIDLQNFLPTHSIVPQPEEIAANLKEWRDSVATLFDIELLEEPFSASMKGYSLSSLLCGTTRATAQRFIRDRDVIRRSGIDHLLVQVYSEGGFEGTADGRPIVVGPGDVCIFDLSRPFETEASTFVNANLVVPRHLLGILPGDDKLHGLMVPAASSIGRLLGHHLTGLADICADAQDSDCEKIVAATLALLSVLVTNVDLAPAPGRVPSSESLFGRLCEYIDEHLGESDLTVPRLCSHFGLSRASLYRIFDPMGGVTTHIRNRRLARAFTALISPHAASERISKVAARCGFDNEDTFARAFKARYEVGPMQLRQRGLQALAILDAGVEPVDNIVGQWMRSLSGGRERPSRPVGG